MMSIGIVHQFIMLTVNTTYRRANEFKSSLAWASCQIRKGEGCACARNAGNVFPPPWVSDLDMHHGTCVTQVSWCMPGSLTSGFLWSWWREKRSRHSRFMRNPQFYISDERPIEMQKICEPCMSSVILFVLTCWHNTLTALLSIKIHTAFSCLVLFW